MQLLDRFFDAFGVQVEQRQVGAADSKGLRDRSAEVPGGPGDNDHGLIEFAHLFLSLKHCCAVAG